MGSRNLLFAVLGIVAGLVFFVTGVKERSALSRTKAVGVAAVVEPVANYTKRRSSGSTTYTAEFTFKTDTGSVVTRRRSFPEELLADFRSGTPVKVIYDPRDPSEFVFEKEKPSWFLILAGSGFLVASLFLAMRRVA